MPGVDLCGRSAGNGMQRLCHAAFFERGADDKRSAAGRQCPGEQALGLAGVGAEKVLQRSAAGDGERSEFVLLHQLAGAIEALLTLGGSDGHSLVRAVLQGEDRRWKRLAVGLFGSPTLG